ncbi:MAG: PSD1 domain-containing protein [Verrucomicrobia bacterium]|nr:PSD1 domain-containing protein [Verrucomicrobiota bacterium]
MKSKILSPLGIAAGLACSLMLSANLGAAAIEFSRDIEPILIKRCSECHGPDQQKSNLRLDSRAAALKAGKSGALALVPGQPDASELMKRITTTDSDEVMPPKGGPLTEREVAAMRQWIAEGAVWPEVDATKHWAFQRPMRPEPPKVTNPRWVKNEVDRFILARLEKEGLQPQSEADRYTLARRVYLDLTGLPPSWAEVQTFVDDKSPEAYERLVDRLLASPHYGEHMARGWLDLARYADSNGYQVDLARSIWPYREWVINAFNRNQPFDQFTIDQLAGDLLPHPTIEQKIATGFNRNTKINDEGGGDAEEYRVKAVKDRVATVGTAWLGLTLNCAECHTHKYDPITHDEYYQFYAFFNNTTDGGNYSVAPTIEVPKPDLSESISYVRSQLEQTKRDLVAATNALAVEQRQWEKLASKSGNVWKVLNLTNTYSTGGSSYTNLPDGSVLGTGVNPIYDTITVDADTELTGITAVLLEVLPDPSLPKNGPGRWGASGNFILDEFSFSAAPLHGARPAETNQFFAKATADWEQLYYRAEHAVDRNPKTGWAIGPHFGQRHFLIAELKQPAGFKGGSRLSFRFDHYHGNSHCVGRFRISVTTEKNADALWPVPDEIRSVVATKASRRTGEQSRQLADYFATASPTIRNLERERIRLEQRLKELASPKSTTLVMQERTNAQPRQTYVHVRGDFLTKGKDVSAGVPAVFPPLPANQPANRLALARWLVDPANPLTARVTVNRFWERCFGTGLVKTSEDFGRQGETPSHPELLDWLATEFIRTGWDVKAMQKLIVMSATYRQDAATDATRLEKDFYNRLLSRGPRFRMDAEMIRDQALAVSGLLNPKLGGPSVYPEQVPNLWKEIGFLRPEIGMDEWPVSEGPDLYRRAIYTFWRRVCTYPTFATFDAPSRDVCVSRRPRTNTPLQALAGLNEPTLIEAARVFAQRILKEGGANDDARLAFAFRVCAGREPTVQEQTRLRSFLDQQLKSFRRDRTSAETLLQIGAAPLPSDTDARQLAAWMMVANVLFNLDETLTKG